MRYTIITPTLLRDTLPRLCTSIDRQTCVDWEHVVMVDVDRRDISDHHREMLSTVEHPQRKVAVCEQAHRNTGNTCRRNAYAHAHGDYLLYIDDDNYLADNNVLETLERVTEPVCLFPLLFQGKQGPVLPVKVGSSDGNQLMVRREIGIWPESDSRAADGDLIVDLTAQHPYEVYTERPLVVYEFARHGR